MKTFKVKLVSTDPKFMRWKTMPAKVAEIRAALNTVKNGKFTIDVEYREGLRPEVLNGYITHDWFDGLSGPYYDVGYDFVVFHMSDDQKERFGVKPGLNGAAQNDFDMIGEAYVMCDEHDKRGSFDKLVQVVLHEIRHLLKYGTKQVDDTHTLHGSDKDIRGTFSNIDMTNYQPKWYNLRAQVSLLARAVSLLNRYLFMKTLYQAALESLNVDISPLDRAKDVVGCAESASEVIRKVVPDFPVILGTYTMWQRFENDPRFKRVTIPMPGTIIISPTGTSKKNPASFPGHVGIFLAGDKIASNTSANGKFEQNYTLGSWKKRWELSGGYPVYYYSLVK